MYILDLREEEIRFGMIPYIADEEDFVNLGSSFEIFIKNLYNVSKNGFDFKIDNQN